VDRELYTENSSRKKSLYKRRNDKGRNGKERNGRRCPKGTSGRSKSSP